MPQALIYNYLHLIWSTKNREPFITDEIAPKLYDYMGGIIKRNHCKPIQIGGHRDHIHILLIHSQKVALMNVIEKVKSGSSGWIKKQGSTFKNFYWQRGYGSFSANPTEVPTVIDYIQNQKERHKNMTFQDEYRAFLRKYNVEYDERYVWD